MSLVTVLKASLNYLDRQIFDDFNFQVEPGERIGLVGPNGAGKTTLLRLIRGEIEPDKGEVRVTKGARICYLPQDIQENLSGPLLESVIKSVPERVFLDNELRILEESLALTSRKKDQADVAQKISEIHQKI